MAGRPGAAPGSTRGHHTRGVLRRRCGSARRGGPALRRALLVARRRSARGPCPRSTWLRARPVPF